VRQMLAELFDLPKDVVLDLPRITLVGNFQLTVENHRGVALYRREQIVIGCSGGRISISGRDLEIGYIYREEIAIAGHIQRVEIESSHSNDAPGSADAGDEA